MDEFYIEDSLQNEWELYCLPGMKDKSILEKVNSLTASGEFLPLVMIFANSLDPDQA